MAEIVNKGGNLHRVMDAVKETLSKVEENAKATNTVAEAQDEIHQRLKEINDRCDALDKILPQGDKDYTPAGTTDRQKAIRNYGGAFTQAWRKNQGLPLDDAYQRVSQNEGVESQGGVLVPDEVLPDVIRIIEEKSIARQICRVIPMARDKMDIPTRSAGPATAWFTEDSAITEDVSVVTFGTPQLDSETLVCLDSISKDLNADSIIALEPVLAELFAEAMAREENAQCFSATTPFTGAVQDASFSTTIAATHYSAVTFDELIELKFKVDSNVIGMGTWVFHPTVFQYIVALKDSNNHPIYASNWSSGMGDWAMPNVPQALPGSLLGSPVYLSTTMPSTNATGLKFGVYGDFSKRVFGDRQQFKVEVDDSVYFAKRKRAILASERFAQVTALADAFATIVVG
jgi:HK97 family phage major capsid protein